MRSKSNASKFKGRVPKNRSRKKSPFRTGKISRVEEVARGLQFNYREIPYKRLQFRYLDTFNGECLDELIVSNANYASREQLQMFAKIFTSRLKEMW